MPAMKKLYNVQVELNTAQKELEGILESHSDQLALSFRNLQASMKLVVEHQSSADAMEILRRTSELQQHIIEKADMNKRIEAFTLRMRKIVLENGKDIRRKQQAKANNNETPKSKKPRQEHDVLLLDDPASEFPSIVEPHNSEINNSENYSAVDRELTFLLERRSTPEASCSPDRISSKSAIVETNLWCPKSPETAPVCKWGT